MVYKEAEISKKKGRQPSRRMGKSHMHFRNKEIQKSAKNIKRCPPLLVIREMEMKA